MVLKNQIPQPFNFAASPPSHVPQNFGQFLPRLSYPNPTAAPPPAPHLSAYKSCPGSKTCRRHSCPAKARTPINPAMGTTTYLESSPHPPSPAESLPPAATGSTPSLPATSPPAVRGRSAIPKSNPTN